MTLGERYCTICGRASHNHDDTTHRFSQSGVWMQPPPISVDAGVTWGQFTSPKTEPSVRMLPGALCTACDGFGVFRVGRSLNKATCKRCGGSCYEPSNLGTIRSVLDGDGEDGA